MDNMLVDISKVDCCATGYKRDDMLEHCKRVSDLAILLCRTLGVDKSTLYTTVFSAAVHDVGKKYLDKNVLDKPGRLTQREYEYIKMHVEYGVSVLVEKGYFNAKILRSVLYHHENFDGTGYKGLKGKEIPLGARIIRICDYWDAITTDRPYRSKLSKDEAIEILMKDKRFFDPILFEQFINLI